MDISQLRTSFLEALKSSPSRALSNQFLEALQRSAVNLGYMEPQQRLQNLDRDKVFEVFWSFVNEGVLIPGVNLDNLNLPAFTITEHGLRVINSEDPTPHDPDRYLQRLKQVAPRVDDVAMLYVEEGLKCFQSGTYTAAVVMLGVSAERITITYAKAVAAALPNTDGERLDRFIDRDKIAKIYDETKKRLEPRVNFLPADLRDGLIAHTDGVFATIRLNRNDAGHPTGKVIDRLDAFGLFSSFPLYCRVTSRMMDYMETNGLDLP